MSAAGPSLSAGQSALRQAKRSLRKQMGAQLDALSASSIAQQSSQITSHALNQPAFHQADKISIYVSMEKGEVKTEDLCRETLALGKRLYVPKFATLAAASGSNAKFESDMRMLRIYNWKDYEAMVINKWGIREPADVIDERNREDALDEKSGGDGLDLILAPGVAFDTAGGRLGHGKGYYDRYIGQCQHFQRERGRDGPVTIALALQEQMLTEPERVPTDDNDLPLDNIITPSGPLFVTPRSDG